MIKLILFLICLLLTIVYFAAFSLVGVSLFALVQWQRNKIDTKFIKIILLTFVIEIVTITGTYIMSKLLLEILYILEYSI
jgi:hypothetical protein